MPTTGLNNKTFVQAKFYVKHGLFGNTGITEQTGSMAFEYRNIY